MSWPIRFHSDDSGEVVAEARVDTLHPFIGMRFPAPDIPVQASRLYTINTLRLIADVHDAPVLSRATAMRSGEIEAARTRLLAMLGHDLRDPLQTISMVGQLMVRSADARLGQRITKSTGRMQRLDTQVPDVSRLQGGLRLGLQFAPADLTTMVRALVIELPAPESLMAPCDGDRIAQVFSNMVDNARNHGTAGEQIGVTLRAEATEILLTVSNSAASIPGAVIRRIFDPFKPRAESNLKNRAGWAWACTSPNGWQGPTMGRWFTDATMPSGV